MHVKTHHVVFGVLVGSFISIYVMYSFNYFSLSMGNGSIEETSCVMTAYSMGRLGNNLLEYATLYALAKLNRCKAIVSPMMASYLRSCFHITMETNETADQLALWKSFHLDYLMKDEYRNLLIGHNDSHVRLTGYPSDWRYFADFDKQIHNEFTFSRRTLTLIDNFLHTSRQFITSNENSTFIGVHVRRTDYLPYLARQNCEVAGPGYLRAAMTLMQSRYPDSIFVIASDNIKWCQEVISGFGFRTVFVPQSYSPCATMAVMAHCNHSIITQGTFGFWGAYLAQGDAVYYSNYCNNRTEILQKFRGIHLRHWMAIPATVDANEPSLERDE